MKYSKWKAGYKCINCSEELTNYEIMYSSGICPKCGHRGFKSINMVFIREFVYRYKIYWDLKYPFRHKVRETKEAYGKF